MKNIKMKSIFVSIASYRDPELEHTVKSLFDNSSGLNNIYIGIVCQATKNETPDFSMYKNISMITMHPRDARGVGFARAKAMELYRNEDYFLQIDSHSQFTKNWDVSLIDLYDLALTKSKKVIISAFPGMYLLESNKRNFVDVQKNNNMTYPCKQKLAKRKNGDWSAERVEFEDKEFSFLEESNTILAGFIFSSGKIVKEVPYDPEISFMGEEVCFAARAWTRGYNIYSPKNFLIYHFYGRNGYKKIWKDDNVRPVSWKEIQEISKEKQKNVLCGIEKGIYGLGKVRSIKKYESLIGFDFKEHYCLTKLSD